MVVWDWNYFNVIYFKEYGEILFEIVIDFLGFVYDELFEIMGEKFMLFE